MPKIIPVVNAPDFEAVVVRVRVAERLQPENGWVHIDITDGIFTPYRTWNAPEELPNLTTSLNVEVHLMVSDPEQAADRWLRAGVRRVIVHLEAMTDSVYIHEKCRLHNAEAMLAIAPQTDPERLLAHTDFSYFQILAVPPGPPGQALDSAMLERVRFLRGKMPDATIEIDGGVTDETAPRMASAGADILVSGSYIFNSSDPEAAYRRLIEAATAS
jgi:ribulose-phosphate 3-epimerase